MERLAEECELSCAEEKQIQVVEKCLPLLRPDRDNKTKALGFLLLTRILEKCSPQCLRAAQSRLGKKLVDVRDDPTVHGGLFLRQLLIRNPQVGNLHADVIFSIIMRLMDMALSSNDAVLRDLAIEIYSIRYGCDDQMSERLLNTLAASLTPRLVSQEERNGILPLKSFGLSSLREDLCCLLFDTYSSALAYAKQAQYIARGVLLPVLESGLNDEAIRNSALGTIRSLCSNCGSSLLPIISRIIIMLISKLDKPNSALFETLAHIGRMYGSGSTLFRHFYVIFGAMKHPLDEQEYGETAASLLATIVETSSFLVKPEVLMSVQRKICEEIIRNPSSPSYCRILIAFLSCTYEVVPPPVHIARTVLGRCADPLQSQHLRSLCDIISRPRIQNLAGLEVIRRCDVEMQESSDHLDKEQQSSKSVEIGNEESVPHREYIEEVKQSSIVCEEPMDDTVVEIQKTLIAAGTEKSVIWEEDKAEKEMKQQEATVPDMKVSNPSSTASNLPSSSGASTTVSPLSKVETTSAEEPVLKKAKFIKKKKKPVENTILAEGEASVEEILSTFCPE